MPSRFSPSRRTFAALAVAILAGIVSGFFLLPRSAGPEDALANRATPLFLGQSLPQPNLPDAQRAALARARSYLAGRFRLVLPDKSEREIYLGQFGVELDKVHLARLVRDSRDRTSALYRNLPAVEVMSQVALPLPIAIDRSTALARLFALKDELDRLPADARLDLEKRELIKEVYGRKLDVDASLEAIERALRAGKDRVPLVFLEQKPRRLASELGNVEFSEVVGYFETNYDRSQRQEARTYNLRLAASRLDGHVLLPGEIFDFNAVVGPRDEANGYKVAPVIAEGELVDGIGGGTCQISGTLHGAAFFGGLEIVERYPHTRPSSYIKMGLDATVVYPTINFRIRNPFPFPVVLHETVKNGVVRAEILGPKKPLTVTLIRRVLDSIPYEEVERPDKSLPSGTRVLGQRGVPGFKLRRYRIVRDGLHAVRERWDDVYPPTTQIVRVGTGEKDADSDSKKAVDDPHPEYLADELLVMTLGDSDEGKPSSFAENREPGRFGQAGWTEEAGMPLYKSREQTAERPGRTSETGKKSRKKSRSDERT
ncbi:MAG TPA: VanW family protein [Polyangiaceae bacterium]|nr:VanW family protein [Polyangiaceae bacterium]